MTATTTDMLFRTLLFSCAALPATIVDLKYLRIPDLCSLGGLVCLALFDLLRGPSFAWRNGASAALAFCLFLAIRFVTRGMGLGDLKFAALCAFYCGLPHWFLAMALASALAILCFLLARPLPVGRRGLRIPFAPFLSGGALVAGAARLLAGG